MAIRAIEVLKGWFKRGAYPTEEQFHDWLDSYFHRSEKIPISDIDGLAGELLGKYPKDDGATLEQMVGQLAEDVANIPISPGVGSFAADIQLAQNSGKIDVYLIVRDIVVQEAFKTAGYMAFDVRAIAWMTDYNPTPPPPLSGNVQTGDIFRATVEVYCNCYPAESAGYGSGFTVDGGARQAIDTIENDIRIKVGSFASHGGSLNIDNVKGGVRLINEVM